MNKIYLAIFFLFFVKGTKAQQELYSNKTTSNIQLILDYNNKTFVIIDKNESEYGDCVEIKHLVEGHIEEKNNKIVCKSSSMTYLLQRMNENILINNNLPYLKEYLYIIGRNNRNFKREFLGHWVDGKKDGYWWFFCNGKPTYNILYQRGVIIKKTYTASD